MFNLSKILVPTDFSNGSQDACKYAIALAEKFGGKVDFLHVIPILKYLNESIGKLGLPLDMDKDIYPKIQTNAKERLTAEMQEHVPEKFRGSVHVKIDRNPQDVIVDFAEKHGFDIIVMGARGYHENKLLRGSTTEKVIRNSTVPVLSINGDSMPGSIQRILTPVDLSDLSVTSLLYALSMADSLNAEITLLHVLELYGSPLENEPRAEAGRGDIDSMSKKVMEKIQKHLDALPEGQGNWSISEVDGDAWLKQKNGTGKVRVKVRILRGISAHYAITDFAEEETDLIVMTTHGRSGLSHLFLGSTTERVVMSVNVPVLTIRPPKKKK